MSKRIFLALILAVLNTAHAQIVKGFTASTLSKAELTTTEKFWLSPMGPLARGRGVTGSYGPLGTLGPFGDNFWNATFVMNMMGNWQDFAETLTQLYGPLSQQGPLFLTSELAQHWASFAFPTSVRELLVPGGVLHAVGNAGPLGPLGIAGPLGPHGAHGFDRNLRGDYLNKSKRVVIRKNDLICMNSTRAINSHRQRYLIPRLPLVVNFHSLEVLRLKLRRHVQNGSIYSS
jgi:hypothetical protein